jgi:hypothetical protein
MNKLAIAVVLLAAVGSSAVFAQGKASSGGFQRLIDAQQDGIDYVINTSYQSAGDVLAPEAGRMDPQCLAQRDADDSWPLAAPLRQ